MRIWIETMAAKYLRVEDFEKLIAKGHTLIVANTAIDIAAFQENIYWFEEQLQNGSIIIEIWATPDDMVKKPFFWSSCSIETEPAETLEDAVMELPNNAGILDVAELVEVYGIPKGEWTMGQWAPPAPLSEEAAEILGIPQTTANRTEVMAAAEAKDRMDVFDAYNVEYNRGLATQHCCNAILNSDGTFTEI